MIPNSKPKAKKSKLTVTLPTKAGQVDPNVSNVTGLPAMAPDNAGVWHITGKGDLKRVVPTQSSIFLSPQSQFYNKTAQHEQVHLSQWIAGPGHLAGTVVRPQH